MIVGITGKAGTGKSTLGFMLERMNAVTIAQADPMKEFCKQIFDFDDGQLYGPSELRNAPDYRYPRTPLADLIGALGGESYLTPRYALQKLGTEWGRDCFRDVWINYAIRRARNILDFGRDPLRDVMWSHDSKPRAVVITDVRFNNEIAGIRAAGGIVARIVRPGSGLTGAAAEHASEREQDSIPDHAFDVIVHNTGTLDDLRRDAERIMNYAAR